MRVFVTGGTGLIGPALIRRLCERGDEVVLLTRRAALARERFGEDCTIVEGDPVQAGPWMGAIQNCDAVVNLAGENIFARRWNEEFRTLLRDSRVRSTDHVVGALAKQPRAESGGPKALVNASAIGYCGFRGDEEITEESPPGDDFLARMCVAWESAARNAEANGVRVAVVRIGVVLDRSGGALAQMLTPFKLGLGGPVGSGKQWFSWIHLADLVGIFLLALDRSEATGAINGTAPHPVTNKEFSKALGRALHRPSFLPVPGFALRLRFGQVAEVLTTGQRVLPRRALALGYQFQFPDIDLALAAALVQAPTASTHTTH
jgi:uncharacterized protein